MKKYGWFPTSGARQPMIGDVSQGIEKLINHPNNGIYHICGSECLTIADIAYRVADTLNLDYSLILPVTTKQMGETTPRPRFSGLSIEKARRELGYHHILWKKE